MKFKKTENTVSCEPDMTPMIDMTFQLIAFFMVLLNFGEGEQDARIKLPYSALAKPPESAFEAPLVLQLTDRNTVIWSGDEVTIDQLDGPLNRERQVLERTGRAATDATVIIRADGAAKTGVVQELIKKCQGNGFEKFSLRAKQESN
jgi:biopolymer transport protein ExbD